MRIVPGNFLKYICVAMLVILSVPGFTLPVKKSRWVAKPIVIDGNNEEWPQPYPFKDEIDTKMQYAIANDTGKLYITLKTSDPATKMKLRKNGLTIFVDTTGKKLTNTSFAFVVQDDIKTGAHHKEDTVRSKRSPGDNFSIPPGVAEEHMLRIVSTQVSGTPSCDGNYHTVYNRTGILVAAGVNDFNELVWEIAIPFNCLFASGNACVADRKKISMCFLLYGLSDEDIFELNRSADKRNQNAMPVAGIDSSSAHMQDASKGSDGGAAPVMGANGAMGVGIGNGGKSKGGASPEDAAVNDAVAAMQDRQRAAADNVVWKEVKLSYEP